MGLKLSEGGVRFGSPHYVPTTDLLLWALELPADKEDEWTEKQRVKAEEKKESWRLTVLKAREMVGAYAVFFVLVWYLENGDLHKACGIGRKWNA